MHPEIVQDQSVILISPAAGGVLMSVSAVIVAINASMLNVTRDDN